VGTKPSTPTSAPGTSSERGSSSPEPSSSLGPSSRSTPTCKKVRLPLFHLAVLSGPAPMAADALSSFPSYLLAIVFVGEIQNFISFFVKALINAGVAVGNQTPPILARCTFYSVSSFSPPFRWAFEGYQRLLASPMPSYSLLRRRSSALCHQERSQGGGRFCLQVVEEGSSAHYLHPSLARQGLLRGAQAGCHVRPLLLVYFPSPNAG
jgi:hypothetical protein